MWLAVLFAFIFISLSLAGARGVLPREIGVLSIAGFFFCLVCAILLGYLSRKAAIQGRELTSATTMLVLMAGMLKDEDDATLEKIAAKGGPAGDAASMILQRRRVT
jgi:hypothetical protein